MLVYVSTLAVLLVGIFTLAGCTREMTNVKSTFQAALNPNSALPELVYSGEKPQLPEFTVWEYAALSEPPVDIKKLLARIWQGHEYEAYEHGEFGMFYRLPLYQSKYGKFREELDTFGNGFIYRWEINENYPQARLMDKSPEQAYDEAVEYARHFLGANRYTEYPVPFMMAIDEDGTLIKHFYEFSWEHRISSIPVSVKGCTCASSPRVYHSYD